MQGKPDEYIAIPEKIYQLLRKRFETEANRDSAQVAFDNRAQGPAEEVAKYLDALPKWSLSDRRLIQKRIFRRGRKR